MTYIPLIIYSSNFFKFSSALPLKEKPSIKRLLSTSSVSASSPSPSLSLSILTLRKYPLQPICLLTCRPIALRPMPKPSPSARIRMRPCPRVCCLGRLLHRIHHSGRDHTRQQVRRSQVPTLTYERLIAFIIWRICLLSLMLTIGKKKKKKQVHVTPTSFLPQVFMESNFEKCEMAGF